MASGSGRGYGLYSGRKIWLSIKTTKSEHPFFDSEKILILLQEYAASLIIPLSNIINAVEIDPISRSKAHCMQVIAEEKSYRFCASSEDALAEWLGALKSQLTKRKDKKAGTS